MLLEDWNKELDTKKLSGTGLPIFTTIFNSTCYKEVRVRKNSDVEHKERRTESRVICWPIVPREKVQSVCYLCSSAKLLGRILPISLFFFSSYYFLGVRKVPSIKLPVQYHKN